MLGVRNLVFINFFLRFWDKVILFESFILSLSN